MALPDIFVGTPTEAGIWTAAVGSQANIADSIANSPIFIGIVALSIGLAIIRLLSGIGFADGNKTHIKRFCLFLFCVSLGATFLRKANSTTFSPLNANGMPWRSVTKVANNPKYSALQNNTNGLFWYTLIHRGFMEGSQFLTDKVSQATDDNWNHVAPEYLLNALAQTARATIDDPAIENSFDTLVYSCSDTPKGYILGNTTSVKSMFNLSDPKCLEMYSQLTAQLQTWAQNERPKYFNFPSGSPPSSVGVFQLANASVVDNKIIASAVKNYARSKIGEARYTNTNQAALIDGSDFWVNVKQSFSPNAFLTLSNFFAEKDLEGAAARNEAAVTYNRLLMFIPAIRGYAAALLAYMFLVAAIGLSVGTPSYFFGWLKMTAIFSLYQPLSAALYQFTTKLITTTENITAMNSLANDPMVLAGAHIIDSNVARITAVYFCMQMVLIATVAAGGISAFQPIHQIRHSFIGSLTQVFHNSLRSLSHVAHRSFLTAKQSAAEKSKPKLDIVLGEKRNKT